MKLHIPLLLTFLCLGTSAIGQIKIGDNPQNIDGASVLELESISRALVITRVNTAQMNTIAPLPGGLVYNTDTSCVHYFDGSLWKNLCESENITLVQTDDNTYTFTNSDLGTTEINNTTNVSLTLEDGNLVLTDSDANSLSVPLTALTTQTFTTEARINTNETIAIERAGSNFNFEVAKNSINSSNITGGGVNGFNIADGSVGNDDLQDRSVGPGKIQDNAVDSVNIVDRSISPLDLAPSPIPNQVLATNATSTEVAWATLNAANIVGEDLTAPEGSINIAGGIGAILTNTTIDVADLGITTAKLAADAVDNTKLADDAIQTENILDGTIGTLDIADDAVITDKIGTAGLADANRIMVTDAAGDPLWIDPEFLVDGTTIEINTTTGQIQVAENGITDIQLDKPNIPISGFGVAGAALDLGGNQINNLQDPTLNQDGATKLYVDTAVGGLSGSIVSSDTGNLILASTTDDGAFYDGDFGNLINVPTGVADGDDDTTYTAGNGLTLSATNQFSVDNANIAPDFANLTNLPPNLDIDSTNDFDGIFGSLTSIPSGLADGDDDTTYTAGNGLTLSATNQFAVDNTSIAPDFANLTNLPPNLDIDSTNDFDGVFGSLTSIPTGLSDGDDDTTYTAGTGITISGTNVIAIDNATITNLANANLTQNPSTNRTYDINSGNLSFIGSGNFGIGNGANPPSNKLHVAGTIRSEGYLNSNGTNGEPSYRFNSDTDTGIYRGSLANFLRFTTAGTEAITIDPSQNVGIGIVPTQRLHVNGNILATGTITPDYVFQKFFEGKSDLKPEYNMMSLQEVENFVRTYKHLPRVPSAKEVEEQGGILINRATEINLEKIEELFLHTIGQEKKIKSLESENRLLKEELKALKSGLEEIKSMLSEKHHED